MSASTNSYARATVPPLYHALAAAFVAWCVWLALRHPELYSAAMQEDRAVEWATVLFFGAAGVIGLVRAVRQRRFFDGLVALFCLVFAGEEMSWGQRLFGLTPPVYFLEHNRQQEINLHNFAALFGSPKGPFAMVLFGYCVVLPLVALTERGRRLLSRIGATPPAALAIPWLGVAIILLFWYPFKFTGEWVELLAGSAFFVATGVPAVALLASSAAGAAISLALAAWSAKGTIDPTRVACATAEVRAIADALGNGGAEPDLLEASSVHKRVWTMGDEGYVDFDTVQRSLGAVRCANESSAPTRRRFAVDPWGTAYWVRFASHDGARLATVYSFGPNRRRDLDAAAADTGDDIVARERVAAR